MIAEKEIRCKFVRRTTVVLSLVKLNLCFIKQGKVRHATISHAFNSNRHIIECNLKDLIVLSSAY